MTDLRSARRRRSLGAMMMGAALTLVGAPARSAGPPQLQAEGTILIGQSAALSGQERELGAEMRAGALAYFHVANSRGGVFGRLLQLKTYDDGGIPSRARDNTRQLIEQDNAFALLGYTGTAAVAEAMPVFTSARVPLVGPLTGAEDTRTPFNRYIFNVRGGYFTETEKIIDLLVQLNTSKIGVFYQNDAYGKAGLAGVNRAMKLHGLAISAIASVEPNSENVASAAKTLAADNPQAVILVGTYKQCNAFIRQVKAAGATTRFVNVSFVGSKALASELGDTGRGVVVSQVVPFPWDTRLALVREYSDAMKATGASDGVSFTSLEGFLAAKVLVEGLVRAGRDASRERFIDALETLRDYDAGGFHIDYANGDHSGSRFVELTMISDGQRFIR